MARHRFHYHLPFGFTLVLAIIFFAPLTLFVRKSNGHEPVPGTRIEPIPLPAAAGPVLLDHLACDRTTGAIWVPGSNTGNVYVIKDSGAISVIGGFKTGDVEVEGENAKLGPTAVALTTTFAYIGNRADSTLCVVDAQTLKRESCVIVKHKLDVNDSGPHAVAYIDVTKEIWVTTGPGKSIQIFDVSDPKHPRWKTEISLESGSEGYAIDNQHGRFYTNLDGLGRTIAIDVRSHKIVGGWNLESKEAQGIALDVQRSFIFVACNDHVVSLDANHNDKTLDSLVTGAGLDDIDFSAEENVLYAAASVTATLTIAVVDDRGRFHLQDLVATAKGSRGVTVGKNGVAYLIGPAQGQIFRVRRK